MDEAPGITQAEWVLMRVLWKHDWMTAAEVHAAVVAETGWHPKTVRTLLGRLVSKGMVQREKRGSTLRFAATASETDSVRRDSLSFLERCFGGMLQPMLAHFLEYEKVDAKTLVELQRLLDEKSRGVNDREEERK